MKIRYETGIAAMIQFLAVTLLSFFVSLIDIVSNCHDAGSTYDCVSGIGINLLYVILLAAWLGFIWVLAYAVQDKRDHRLARILMGAEAMVLVVSLFNAKHYPNLLALLTSLVDAAMAAWVIWLAFRLSRAKGGRITGRATRAGHRPRRRPTIKVEEK